MKKLILVIALGLSAIATLPAYAATAAGTFNVVINLTSKCEINSTNASTGAVINDVVFNYTSFQTTAATSTGGGFNVRCTNSLPYTLALSNLGVTDDAVNLAYTLALSATTGTGNGTDQAFTVNGTMAAGQAGTCALATCANTAATNKTKTLTITY
jgi:spore coat protein U-like protein